VAAARTATVPHRETADAGGTPCPLCDGSMYPWVAVPADPGSASVGTTVEGERVLDRCESCGLAAEASRPIDLAAEWRAVCPSGTGPVRVPNRGSIQALIGVEGWAGFDRSPGGLLLTREALELLAERNGARIESLGTPPTWRAQGWMWQTLVNGLTFRNNFARDFRSGRLQPASGGERLKFAIDAIVSVLAAPLVALVSVPLELIAVLLGRGGELTGQASRR